MKKGIIATAIIIIAMVAILATGCTNGIITSGKPAEDGSNFRLLISDENNAISDFASLNITITKIGLLPTGDAGEWITYDAETGFEPKTADLTKLTGDNATEIFNGYVPASDYKKVFIYAENATGILDTPDGEVPVYVKLPSGKLQISKPFTLSTLGENATVNFVFDVTVIRAGKSQVDGLDKYILKPQIDESGPNQNFVEVEPQGKTLKNTEQNQEPPGQHKEKHGKPEDDL